jgi:hypothetical protein
MCSDHFKIAAVRKLMKPALHISICSPLCRAFLAWRRGGGVLKAEMNLNAATVS